MCAIRELLLYQAATCLMCSGKTQTPRMSALLSDQRGATSLHVTSVKSDGASLDLVGMVPCLYQEIVSELCGVGHEQTFSGGYGCDWSSGAVCRL